jgi:small subunit ribosomal protein S16
VLVIRLSRTGRKKQATYRLVVAEHTSPVQGKFHEIVGSYNPGEGKKLVFNKERVDYWVSVGAKPSNTVAGLLKFNGVKDMEKFMDPKNKKRPVKNPPEEPEAPAAPAPVAQAPAAEEPAKEEAPAEEEAPAAEEPAKEEEAPAAAEEPAKEEEAPAEEAAPAAEEPAKEE